MWYLHGYCDFAGTRTLAADVLNAATIQCSLTNSTSSKYTKGGQEEEEKCTAEGGQKEEEDKVEMGMQPVNTHTHTNTNTENHAH